MTPPVTQTRIYDFNSLSTPLRTNNCTYVAPKPNYIRNLVISCTNLDRSMEYDTWQLPNRQIENISGTASMHDTANYGTTVTNRGLPTRITPSNGPSVELSYNILGEVVKAVDATGKIVTYQYQQSNNFMAPTSMTPNNNPNLQVSMTWDSNFRLAGASSPNGSSSSIGYDSNGRISSKSNSSGAGVAYTYDDAARIRYENPNNGGRIKHSMDGLGRTIKSESQDDAGVTQSIVDTEYDWCACTPSGKMKRVSLPYAPGGAVKWSTYTYDGLGRTLTIVQPDGAGTTSYLYEGNQITVTDPAGRWKKYTMDAAGQLTQVTEPNPQYGQPNQTQFYDTYYTYDSYGQLTRVRMPRPNGLGGAVEQNRYFNYSGTRLLSTQHPESGTTTYNYGSDGQVSFTTDAKGQKKEYTYDINGRVTKVTPKDAAGNVQGCEVVEYQYDQWQDGYGRPTTVKWGSIHTSGSGGGIGQPGDPTLICPKGLHLEEYHYTSGGQILSKTIRVRRKYPNLADLPEPKELTGSMTVTYEYDLGRLKKVTYPKTRSFDGAWQETQGHVFTYNYDGLGRPTGETYKWQGQGADQTLVDLVQYNFAGQMTQMRSQGLAQTFTETRQYNQFQQLTRLTGGGIDLEYKYSATANDGRITAMKDWGSGEEVQYQYDQLQRLTRAETIGPQWGLSWVYDGFGNRLQQNAVKGTVPTQSVLADMNTNRLQNWSYDANGNAVNIPGVGSLTYDISNRVKTAGGETYEYAPDNKRIWKNDTYFLWSGGMRIGTFTLTQATNFSGDPNQVGEDPPGGVGSFNPKYRLIFGQVTADYYFGGRKLKPMDRLGSQGGNNYYPYGEERTVTANPADKFATYHRDGTGLDYADQRYYSSGSGRFVTVDPAPADNAIVLTGNWNRYAYVGGDPVNKTDPMGLCSPQDNPPCFSATAYGTPPGGFGGGYGRSTAPESAALMWDSSFDLVSNAAAAETALSRATTFLLRITEGTFLQKMVAPISYRRSRPIEE